MDNLLNEIDENISGIWANQKYELLLGLNNVFTFEEKESGEIIDGTYSIILDTKDGYITLRLTELNGINHDYIIIEVSAFKTLIISNKRERINLKNVPPDEYEGETFNTANN
ncbi:MAG: hypothetical protein WDN26_07145 [Chitinophagaceae bacterium]